MTSSITWWQRNIGALLRLKECIRQRYFIDVLHFRIGSKFWIYVEKHWHVDLDSVIGLFDIDQTMMTELFTKYFYLFVWIKSLLFETKALNFIEISSSIERYNIVGTNSNYG